MVIYYGGVVFLLPSVFFKDFSGDGDSFDAIRPYSVGYFPFFSVEFKQTSKSLLVFTGSFGVYGYDFTNCSFGNHAVITADPYIIPYS